MKIDKDMNQLVDEMKSLKIEEKKHPEIQVKTNDDHDIFSDDSKNYFGLKKISQDLMKKIRKIKREKILGEKRGLKKTRFIEDYNNSDKSRKKLVLVTTDGKMKEINPEQHETTFSDSKRKKPDI